MTAEEEFIKYTDPYQKYGIKIDLKVKHTLRVRDLCIQIAKSENLSEEDISLASLCGLLHDIGRFEQWKRYSSYNDLQTLDHGDLGVEILKHNNFINKFTDEHIDTILHAVKYHNKYKVPNTISNKDKFFTNITRDADKIDILYLFSIKDLSTNLDDSVMTKKIFNSIKNTEQIKRVDVKTRADEIAVRLGFVFDLNFKESFKILKEKNYINTMLDVQVKDTKNQELINQIEELRVLVNNYIEERIKC